jgi:hypothetical protein
MSVLPPTAHIGLNGTNLWDARARILELMMMDQFPIGGVGQYSIGVDKQSKRRELVLFHRS